MHLSIEAESDSEHFQFLTYHYSGKLGIFIEVEFLSDPNIAFLSSLKLMFRDQDRIFLFVITLAKSNPNFPLNQKTNTTEDQLDIHFSSSQIGNI